MHANTWVDSKHDNKHFAAEFPTAWDLTQASPLTTFVENGSISASGFSHPSAGPDRFSHPSAGPDRLALVELLLLLNARLRRGLST